MQYDSQCFVQYKKLVGVGVGGQSSFMKKALGVVCMLCARTVNTIATPTKL